MKLAPFTSALPLWVVLFAFAVTSRADDTAAALTAPATQPAGDAARPGWKLAWSDEFNYTGLPDPAKWGYEVGYIRNNEVQYYTRARRENARVENGMLVIEVRKEDYIDPTPPRRSHGPIPARYTSASLNTHSKFDWTFGRIEMRAKIPQGKGIWPAFWMLGNKGGWPGGGEIDIMEFVGKDPNHIHGTVHFAKDGKHKSSGDKIEIDKPFDDFHVYAVEWSADRIDFFVDQTKYHSFPVEQADDKGQNPFHKPQYVLLNLAIGGEWGGKIDDTVLPQKYLIDYVRVYQRPESKP